VEQLLTAHGAPDADAQRDARAELAETNLVLVVSRVVRIFFLAEVFFINGVFERFGFVGS
jgi:hypothetical protein